MTHHTPNKARTAAIEDCNTGSSIVLQEGPTAKESRGFVRRIDLSEQYLLKSYQCYVRLCSEQQKIMASNRDIRKAVLAFRDLPNLKSVQTYDTPSESSEPFDLQMSTEESSVPFLLSLQRATLLKNPFCYTGPLEALSISRTRSLASMITSLGWLHDTSRV